MHKPFELLEILKSVQTNNNIWKNTVNQSQMCDDITLLFLSPQTGHDGAGQAEGVATSHRGRALAH